MSRTDIIVLTTALTLALHLLGAATNVWVVMYLSGSFCLALIVGRFIAVGAGADMARDHD